MGPMSKNKLQRNRVTLLGFYITPHECYHTRMVRVELSWVESRYLYAALNSLLSHNGAGRCFTHAGKAESSAGAWRCSATVRGLVAKEVDCSRLRGRIPRSSAGQWKSELWAREGFQSLQSAIDAFPRLKLPEYTDRQGNAALCRVDISTPELLSWKWCAGELEASEVLQEPVRCGHTAERRLPNEQPRSAVTAGDGCVHQPCQLRVSCNSPSDNSQMLELMHVLPQLAVNDGWCVKFQVKVSVGVGID